jgi:hypothetical protein
MKARITAEICTIWLIRLFDGLGYFVFLILVFFYRTYKLILGDAIYALGGLFFFFMQSIQTVKFQSPATGLARP